MSCGRCHTCGTKLQIVLDGEEWCPKCQTFRRYPSHGWAWAHRDGRENKCPDWTQKERRATMATEYQYWRHVESGEVWAVEIVDGIVTGACGPLYDEDRPDDMRDFEYDREDGDWIETNQDQFVLEERA